MKDNVIWSSREIDLEYFANHFGCRIVDAGALNYCTIAISMIT